MTKQIPAILLAIACAVLAFALYSAKQENVQLTQQVAELEAATAESVARAGRPAAESSADEPAAVVQAAEPELITQLTEPTPAPEANESSGRRMMKSLAQMMENPTMNKVMEASQRGAIGALYSDLIEYLDLNAEETKYFMDLLMSRQMKQVDLSMKMMAGGMSEEEKQKMVEELKEARKTVKTEMKQFLNNKDDFAEFKFYEKTMSERMMLSQMDKDLAESDSELSDETYRELLGMMHDEKQNFEPTSDLHDEKNMDLSPERFSKENLQDYADDMDRLIESMIRNAESMLTSAQLEAFVEAIKATVEMQKAQLEMAAKMFGGEPPKAP
jgi:hypothetical protein